MIDYLPKISIVTVVLNRMTDIEFTLKSITEQSYSQIEYIVIDGGSTDGTLEIIQKYSEKIHLFISEKDKGIYDAMNKGITHASGDYILFINGGDQIHAKSTVENIFKQSYTDHPKPDIIYGECMLIDKERKPICPRSQYRKQKFPTTLTHDSFKMGTNVSHQSFITKRENCPLFDLKYKWSSDIDWMLNCILQAKKIVGTSEVISDFVVGDASEQNKSDALRERFSIMKKHYGIASTLYSHFLIALKKMDS